MKQMFLWKKNGDNRKEFFGTEDEFLAIEDFYRKEWVLNKKYHRDGGPAIIWRDGTQHWYQNGERHRENGPTIIHPNGIQSWHVNGKVHRTDGPATIWSDGSQRWFLKGKNYTFLNDLFPMSYWICGE